MSREVKRVPLDFDWPMKKVWEGYINPHKSIDCGYCGGTGLNSKTKELEDKWYSFNDYEWIYLDDNRRYNNKAWCYHLDQDDVNALVAAGRLMDFTHIYNSEKGWVKKNPEYIPTAKEVNEWSHIGIGHDSINSWICVKAKAKRLGIYGQCKKCSGDGYYFVNDEIKKLHEKWEDFEPPTGNGFQMWETTSEGSPMSPVFETREELAQWLVDNNASSFASQTATYEQWLNMIEQEWALSAVMENGVLKSGVEAI
jgi:hypothetical protein